MAYETLASPEANLDAKLQGIDSLRKQVKVLSQTVGNMDERISSLEGLLNSALFKQQEDIKAAWTVINQLDASNTAASKFDLEGQVAAQPGEPPVG